MGRKPPSPALSDTDQLALSQFLAGHLTAGQLSERLQHGEPRSKPSSERPPRRHRNLVAVALGGVVAAIAATAVALAITSRPHVGASHKANAGHSQSPRPQGSARVVSEQRTTSSSAQAPIVSSGERFSVVPPSRPVAHRPKSPKRSGHRSSKPGHLRGGAPPARSVTTSPSTGVGGNAPTGTTPTATAPTATALPPPGSPTTPGGTAHGGG